VDDVTRVATILAFDGLRDVKTLREVLVYLKDLGFSKEDKVLLCNCLLNRIEIFRSLERLRSGTRANQLFRLEHAFDSIWGQGDH
jgi:hypothetical protein